MTNTRRRPPIRKPFLPHVARKGARELAEPLRRMCGAARAVQAWFMAHGDPFDAVNMADVGEEIVGVQDRLTTELAGMSTAHVVGTLLAAAETLRQRMEAALPPARK